MSKKPNILLIMCDQLRASALGCYGNRVARTPWMDFLARDGVRYEEAYSQTPVCVPARYGLLAGLNPCRMGLWDNAEGSVKVENPFPELLNREGYATCAVGKTHFMPSRAPYGFQKKYSSEEIPEYFEDDDYLQFLESRGYGSIDEPHGRRSENYYVPQVSVLPPEIHTTGWTGMKSCEYIRKNANRPFCLFTSFIKPHPPFDPAQRYLDPYLGQEMDACLEGEPLTDLDPAVGLQNDYKVDGTGNLTPEKIREIRRHYYASVTQVDDQIGNILQQLKEKGVYENTLILFTADHGELLGDHRCVGKRSFYESSCRVPLIISWPAEFGGGQVRRQLVSLEDVYATILEAGGVQIPEETEGVSLLQSCRDSKACTHSAIIGGHGFGQYQKYLVLTEEWKYQYFAGGGGEALFDRVLDKGEQYNAAGEYPEICAEFRRMYRDWLVKNGMDGILSEGELPRLPKAQPRRTGFLNQSPKWRGTKEG